MGFVLQIGLQLMIRNNTLMWLYHSLMRDRRFLQRIIVIAAVFFLTTVLGLKTSTFQTKLVFGFLGGILAVLAFLRWPSLGLIVVCVGGMVIPYSGPGGVNAIFPLVALLLCLWLLDMLVRERQIRLVASRTMWPLLAFMAASATSFVSGQLPWFTFAKQAPLVDQLGGFSIYILSACAFLLVANRVRDITWLKAITWTFVALAVIYVALSIFPETAGILKTVFQKTGSLFWIWLVAMAFSQLVINRDLPARWRLALLCIVLATLYVLFFQRFDQKSGWLPVIVTMVAIISIRYWRAGLVLAVGVALSSWKLSSFILEAEQYSLTTRVEAWVIMAQIIRVNPVFGMGFSNYYWITPLFSILGWNVQFNSHNNYIDILAQTGLVGLAFFAWFILEVGRLAWRLRAGTPEGFARAYVYGALGGLLGTIVAGMLGDWVLPFVYNIGLDGFRISVLAWIFLGGLVVLDQIYTRPPTAA